MKNKESKKEQRRQQMTFSLTPNRVDSLIQLCKKYNIKYSKMIRMFIDYFVDNPTELKELTERYI